MRKYCIGVFTNKGLYETTKMHKKDVEDFMDLLKALDIRFQISKYDKRTNTWEACEKEFENEIQKGQSNE